MGNTGTNLKNLAAARMTAIPASVLWCGELGGRCGADRTDQKQPNISINKKKNKDYPNYGVELGKFL